MVRSVEVRLEDDGAGPRYDVSARSAADASEVLTLLGKKTTRGSTASRGSASSEKESRSSFLIAAVAENRAREVGICAVDLAAPYELLLWNVIDSQSYAETLTLLQVYQPVEILVVETAKPQHVNDAINKASIRSTSRIVPVGRKYFDQTKGAEDLRRVMANRIDVNISRNYVVMAAVSCMLQYVEFIQGVFIAEKTMKVVLNPSSNKLLLDQATITSLELVRCSRGDSTRQSLWGILNNTKTSAGNRLLRSTMLQPLRHLKTIQNRQDAVEIFLKNPGWFFDLLEELPNFADIERILSQLVMAPKVITPRVSRLAIGNVIALKHALECLPSLYQCLTSSHTENDQSCELLSTLYSSVRPELFEDIQRDIGLVINERVKVSHSAAQKRIQECFAVRAGIDGMLDVARRTYLDTIEKIHELVHKFKGSMEVPVRLSYSSRRGYHLVLPCNAKDIPSLIVERVPTKKAIYCSTKELKSLNGRLEEALMAVYKLSNNVIQNLLNKIRPRATVLYAMVEGIALLDMLLSFTNVVAASPPDRPYVCPRVSECGSLVIKDGRHPLVERVMQDQDFIPNNTFFGPTSTFHVITGANCAGKSTYMKAVALITILAHMGCHVPATDAFIPLCDRICTRFGTSDDMEENASTFAVEMTETSFILETCTSRSLVLIDELGRGTANDEGQAIAWSVSEELIKRRSYTCFATHYHRMNALAKLYVNCRCYHLGAVPGQNHILFRYKLCDGGLSMSVKYGIITAKICGIPPDVISQAERLYEDITLDCDTLEGERSSGEEHDHDRRLLQQLLALRQVELEDLVLRQHLQHLSKSHLIAEDTKSDE
ncbi:hypothetical protein Poli38472_005709 [Pythium oligandrum]|uniref:DNA mismatch repair proteins mutS family domain-containing protein n=1 Tax=Pythium oligandrum TaxID=41045 RepID=A0A8K1CR11_PYTOL|nr:hypothetical protein Poli38472_005709 [Pythium oligandrum]|eukprot:TMW68241.1 hypothetical protein Poli38472_005709 [Pythium oligandrum]